MGRRKRSSRILDSADMRANSLKSISTTLDLGGGLTVTAYQQAVVDRRAKLDDYNQTLFSVDEKLNQLILSEKSLQDLSERMLAGVAARYGKDSDEYEQAGGVRKSERRRSPRKQNVTSP